MTEDLAALLAAELKDNVLGLDAWDVRIEYVDAELVNPDLRHAADITCDYAYRMAFMRLGLRNSDEQIARSLTHELLHVLLDEQRHAVGIGFAMLGSQAAQVAGTMYEDAEERSVVLLADVLKPQWMAALRRVKKEAAQ